MSGSDNVIGPVTPGGGGGGGAALLIHAGKVEVSAAVFAAIGFETNIPIGATNESIRQWVANRAGTLKNCRLRADNVSDNINVYTLRKNGVPTVLTQTTNPSGMTTYSIAGSVAVVDGDLISVEVDLSTAGLPGANFHFEYDFE